MVGSDTTWKPGVPGPWAGGLTNVGVCPAASCAIAKLIATNARHLNAVAMYSPSVRGVPGRRPKSDCATREEVKCGEESAAPGVVKLSAVFIIADPLSGATQIHQARTGLVDFRPANDD
jgi:hypothetical protein